VVIPQADAEKLGPQLRAVYIMTKKARLLTQPEADALLKVVLRFFLDRATQQPRPGAITPKLYQEQALRAKVMTATGLQTQMNQQQLNSLTGNRGRNHAHHHPR
jgi:hypothetical protein